MILGKIRGLIHYMHFSLVSFIYHSENSIYYIFINQNLINIQII